MTPSLTTTSSDSEVRRVDAERELAGWLEFIQDDDGSTFCHHPGWHGIMQGVLGHSPSYLVARDPEGQVDGVLPLVYVDARPLGRYLVSMPFLNAGGALGSPAARLRLAEAALAEARRRKVDLLELRCPDRGAGGDSAALPEEGDTPGDARATPGRTDPRAGARAFPRRAEGTADAPAPPAGLRPTDRKITVVLPLPATSEQLWKEVLPGKVRSQVRRPRKEGMEVRFGPDQLDSFYPVFARHMRDLGTPVLPVRFFREIRNVFPDAVEFGAVYAGDVPVAAGCGFRWKGRFEITWAAALREYGRSAPNMLLYWGFMERMVEKGLELFDFGRCTPGGGTHRFKRQWGGEDRPLPWLQWSPSGVDATPNPDRPVLRLATRIWQRLPLAVANTVGPHLARRLP